MAKSDSGMKELSVLEVFFLVMLFIFFVIIWFLIIKMLLEFIWKLISKPGKKSVLDYLWIIIAFFLIFVLVGGLTLFK